MAEYIEREALLNRITSLIKEITPIEENRDMFYHDSGWNGAITAASIAVKNAPSEDVAPVRNGRWDKYGLCSYYGKHDFHDAYGEPYGSEYCPHCGAKMDG